MAKTLSGKTLVITGRLLRPLDLAYLTAYLLSDQSIMMTGSLIDFDQKVIGTP